MGLTRPILSRIIQPVSKEAIGFQRDNLVSETIGTAFYNLGFNRAKADNIGSYLIKQNPSIDGTIYDETPNRKTRTELTARATSFSTNQRFFGGNTSTGKTALSVSAWIRPTGAASRVVIAEDDGTTSRSFLMYVDTNNKILVVIWDDVGAIAIQKTTIAAFANSEWHHVAFSLNCQTDAFEMYVNGAAISTSGTQNALDAIYDSSNPIEIGSNSGGASYFDGQIQQPLIYEGVWTPAEVRDLYLGKYDAITAPTYGWFLDGGTAHPLTSSSPTLTPANSPAIYEDDAIGGGDWLNEKGYNTQRNLILWSEDLSNWTDGTATGAGQVATFTAFNKILRKYQSFGTTEDKTGKTYTSRMLVTADQDCNANLYAFGSGAMSFLHDDTVNYPLVAGVPTEIVVTDTAQGDDGYTDRLLWGLRANSFTGTLNITMEELQFEESATATAYQKTTDVQLVTGEVIPKRWDEELDSNGNPADDSNSFGVARRDGQLRGGPCFSFGGTEYATNGNLVGTETVVSSEGTSTPTISAGRIDFTAGTCWNLLLSNGSHYAGSEEAGIIWYDDVNDEHLTFVNTPSWSTQDTYFWSEANGFSLYEHASSADILVPLKSDGTAITITPPTGYTKTADYIAGSYHNNSQALLEEFPVTDSGSQRAVGYGASFNGTTSVVSLGDIGNTTEIQFDLYVPNITGTKALFQLASGDYVQLNAATLEANDIAGATFYVDGTAGTTIAAATWQTVKVTYTTYDSTAVLIGNQSTSFLTGYVRNLSFKNVAADVAILPLYKDSLERSPNCNHGTDTAITYLTEARATNLNPTIAEANTRAVTTGDRKLIRIGQQ